MASKKDHVLAGLDYIEREVGENTGRKHLAPDSAIEVKDKTDSSPEKPEPGTTGHFGSPKDPEDTGAAAEEREVEQEQVATGHFDCPHCGGKMRVK